MSHFKRWSCLALGSLLLLVVAYGVSAAQSPLGGKWDLTLDYGGGAYIVPMSMSLEADGENATIRVLDDGPGPTQQRREGGVGLDNVRQVVQAGVEVCIAGSAVFGAPDPAERMREMRLRAETEVA